MSCVGMYDGSACPHSLSVARDVISLRSLDIDHEYELRAILHKWAQRRANLPKAPSSWDEGIDSNVLRHLCFSLAPSEQHGAPWLKPRCHSCHINMPHERPPLSF